MPPTLTELDEFMFSELCSYLPLKSVLNLASASSECATKVSHYWDRALWLEFKLGLKTTRNIVNSKDQSILDSMRKLILKCPCLKNLEISCPGDLYVEVFHELLDHLQFPKDLAERCRALEYLPYNIGYLDQTPQGLLDLAMAYNGRWPLRSLTIHATAQHEQLWNACYQLRALTINGDGRPFDECFYWLKGQQQQQQQQHSSSGMLTEKLHQVSYFELCLSYEKRGPSQNYQRIEAFRDVVLALADGWRQASRNTSSSSSSSSERKPKPKVKVSLIYFAPISLKDVELLAETYHKFSTVIDITISLYVYLERILDYRISKWLLPCCDTVYLHIDHHIGRLNNTEDTWFTHYWQALTNLSIDGEYILDSAIWKHWPAQLEYLSWKCDDDLIEDCDYAFDGIVELVKSLECLDKLHVLKLRVFVNDGEMRPFFQRLANLKSLRVLKLNLNYYAAGYNDDGDYDDPWEWGQLLRDLETELPNTGIKCFHQELRRLKTSDDDDDDDDDNYDRFDSSSEEEEEEEEQEEVVELVVDEKDGDGQQGKDAVGAQQNQITEKLELKQQDAQDPQIIDSGSADENSKSRNQEPQIKNTASRLCNRVTPFDIDMLQLSDHLINSMLRH